MYLEEGPAIILQHAYLHWNISSYCYGRAWHRLTVYVLADGEVAAMTRLLFIPLLCIHIGTKALSVFLVTVSISIASPHPQQQEILSTDSSQKNSPSLSQKLHFCPRLEQIVLLPHRPIQWSSSTC
jgi:hypothetical protein